MSASDKVAATSSIELEEGRWAVLERFQAEDIQTLSREDLVAAQMLAGHGDTFGFWQTPRSLARLAKNLTSVDLVARLRHVLVGEGVSFIPEPLLEEGVLVLTRWALIARMAPSTKRAYKSNRLGPLTIARVLYSYLPRLVARAIARKSANPKAKGLLSCLTDADQLEFQADRLLRNELERLNLLRSRGLWSDVPHLPGIQATTDPSQARERSAKSRSEPYLPLPDNWLCEIGPRVLWVVQEMGPNLLHLLEALQEEIKGIDWSRSDRVLSGSMQACISRHLSAHPWRTRDGKPLVPPFSLRTCAGRRGQSTLEWPPRTWEQVIALSTTLQTAHLFLVLLASAGRIGEVATLTRACVEIARDGRSFMSGHTYKLSRNLFGDAREWPAPPILCQALGQQGRLAAAWDYLPTSLPKGLPLAPRSNGDLWVSIGNGPKGDGVVIDFNGALLVLAERLGVDPRPGGKGVHAHRFRKTIGRLAGVALFNSPLVLKRLFGHKSIEMTLHYILCDEGVRAEAEAVLRELRIMHCAEALEEIHHAIANDLPLPGNGGAGAARLTGAVRRTQDELKQAGREWRDGSAYDLACLLTMTGQGWRLVQENIVCSKVPGEDGLCQKKRSKGEPNTANCQPECDNRIVFARKRRDVELCIEQYLDIARKARDDGQLLVLASVMHNMKQAWVDFADLEKQYRTKSEVQALLALCEE